jgi:hypothetical protein
MNSSMIDYVLKITFDEMELKSPANMGGRHFPSILGATGVPMKMMDRF